MQNQAPSQNAQSIKQENLLQGAWIYYLKEKV